MYEYKKREELTTVNETMTEVVMLMKRLQYESAKLGKRIDKECPDEYMEFTEPVLTTLAVLDETLRECVTELEVLLDYNIFEDE